ncbi:LmbE family protein [Terriglobus saanensis SP1PR4]|uniref:LmbE family protein n=2 Tax=Terriglobus saanensis TaxID=870903 RepID=E8V8H7_TERSS|nr:LmbE family protein [Terriglobus saanensis SP1PR4]
MCVIAHPDDECFAFGGALALAAREGVEIYVVCLTDGQAATNRGTATTSEELGKIRRVEFAASCDVLGVTKHELLDYQDGQLEFASFSETAGKLVQRIRSWKPQVVLTFGLDGAINTHADHTMVSCFTSAAFHWSARSKRYVGDEEPFAPQKLYHQSTSFILPDRDPLMPAPWTLSLDIREVQDVKVKAFHQHVSQLPVFDKVKPFWDEHGGEEYYLLAAAARPQVAAREQSMFDHVIL